MFPQSELPNPEQKLITQNTEQILNEILNSLSAQQQLIIRLYYMKGLTLAETARVLKMKNLWQVQRKLKKALKYLRSKLKEKGIGPDDLDF